MLSCQELVELVTDYTEGRMSLADRLRFGVHLAQCSHCRAYVREMKAAVRALGHMPPEPMPHDVEHEMRALFANWKKSNNSPG